MITSWENECKVRAEPSLLGFCRTAAAFMKLIMAAHTSWHSSAAASREKQSKEKNGTSRFLSLPMSKPPPYSGWYAKKSPGLLNAVRGSNAYIKNVSISAAFLSNVITLKPSVPSAIWNLGRSLSNPKPMLGADVYSILSIRELVA